MGGAVGTDFEANYVYVSFAASDIRRAREVCLFLHQLGITCWMTPDNLSGTNHAAKTIETALQAAEVIVVVATDAAREDPVVKDEIQAARRSNKQILFISEPNKEHIAQKMLKGRRPLTVELDPHSVDTWANKLSTQFIQNEDDIKLAVQPRRRLPRALLLDFSELAFLALIAIATFVVLLAVLPGLFAIVAGLSLVVMSVFGIRWRHWVFPVLAIIAVLSISFEDQIYTRTLVGKTAVLLVPEQNCRGACAIDHSNYVQIHREFKNYVELWSDVEMIPSKEPSPEQFEAFRNERDFSNLLARMTRDSLLSIPPEPFNRALFLEFTPGTQCGDEEVIVRARFERWELRSPPLTAFGEREAEPGPRMALIAPKDLSKLIAFSFSVNLADQLHRLGSLSGEDLDTTTKQLENTMIDLVADKALDSLNFDLQRMHTISEALPAPYRLTALRKIIEKNIGFDANPKSGSAAERCAKLRSNNLAAGMASMGTGSR